MTHRKRLQSQWIRLCASLGLRKPARTFNRLWSAYCDPQRHYHGIQHIARALGTLNQVRQHCQDPRAVEIALWFHDAVFDPSRKDNEELSIQMARRQLRAMGAAPSLIRRVARLIRATCHDAQPSSDDAAILAD